MRASSCLAAFTTYKSRRLNEQELNSAGLTEFLFFLTSTTVLTGVSKVWWLNVLCKQKAFVSPISAFPHTLEIAISEIVMTWQSFIW